MKNESWERLVRVTVTSRLFSASSECVFSPCLHSTRRYLCLCTGLLKKTQYEASLFQSRVQIDDGERQESVNKCAWVRVSLLFQTDLMRWTGRFFSCIFPKRDSGQLGFNCERGIGLDLFSFQGLIQGNNTWLIFTSD